jgi:tetratricopeptide (TPR) repeat protein
LEVHGKVSFSLGELISDPRQAYVSTIERALECLLTDVMRETTLLEQLFNFAVNLKISDRYKRAQEVIDHILAQVPEHDETLELRADIWNVQENYAEAVLLASRLLQRNPRLWHARTTLTRAYEGLGQWAKVIETATESLTLSDEESDRLDALSRRCSAYWKLGKREESDEDLRSLQNSQRASWKIKWILRDREGAK